LAVTPLPGQSDLDVEAHPWLPNIYTVPFLDGHLVYAVLEWKGLVAVDKLAGGDGGDLAADPVGAGEAAVQQRLELLGGADAGVDVALGRVLGEPLDQVGSQVVGERLVGAVLEALAAAVQLGLGGWGRPAYSTFSGVSTETMRRGWSITGVSPSEMRDRVRGWAPRRVRWKSNATIRVSSGRRDKRR
jgi:hypothetical protein